ncbi:hypothetical protein HRJ34_14675 [Rhizorhabdus wittichii]|uniref:ASCH domain-containing protein n=1 Tax=Rhizorhabdus wittichii TaxID=160791 RepID=A0A975HDD5_9SPHN|nr:hypothetical protein [Rhizorhabdus wittichii]QTH19619.1 hypothetical protein HRJ34_14675 [Rhizorhabdus wittichii]
MTDRPAIFSPAMVQSLLLGWKLQTRRLEDSPLRNAEPGDRLWVRENFHTEAWWDALRKEHRHELALSGHWPGAVWYPAGELFQLAGQKTITHISGLDLDAQWTKGKQWPSIHMPRWASRITLLVEAKRFEPLQDISEADAIAEGIEPVDIAGQRAWKSYETFPDGTPHPHAVVSNRSAVTSYRELWDSLHRKEGERWADNPRVLALTFRVIHENIDRIAA